MITQKLIRQPADKGQVSHQRGFTLIEIMVVILIIGILSSVVLAFMRDARDSAKDAKIQAELDSFRKQAELHREQGVVYTFSCSTDPLLLSIASVSSDVSCDVDNDNRSYVITARLNKEPITYCVDSGGKVGEGILGGDASSGYFCATP